MFTNKHYIHLGPSSETEVFFFFFFGLLIILFCENS